MISPGWATQNTLRRVLAPDNEQPQNEPYPEATSAPEPVSAQTTAESTRPVTPGATDYILAPEDFSSDGYEAQDQSLSD